MSRSKKVPCIHGRGYIRITGRHCEFIGFREAPLIAPEEVKLANGQCIRPGDLILKMGGKRTSAGYFRLEMIEPHSLEFQGVFENEGSKLLLFHKHDGEKIQPMTHDEYPFLFIAYHLLQDGGKWMFCTPAIAGRLVETTLPVIRSLKNSELNRSAEP